MTRKKVSGNMGDFFDEARAGLVAARRRYADFGSLHEACAVMLEEWEEVWTEAGRWKGLISDEQKERVCREYVQIAAMAGRTVEDLRGNSI